MSSQAVRANRVVRHSVLVLLLQVMLLCCAVINNFLLAHMGGPQGKGLLYLMQLVQNQGLSFLHFSLGYSAIYFLGQDRGYSLRDVASAMMIPSLVLGAIPAVLAALAWPLISGVAGKELPPLYLWLALLSIPAVIFSFNVSQFSLGRHRISEYNALGVGASALLAVSLVLLWAGHQARFQYLVVAWFISFCAPAMYAFVLIWRASEGHLWPKRKFLRSAWQFSWRSHLGGVTQQLQHRAPVLLVAYFLPVAQLGIYSVGVSLAELLWYMPNAISTVLMPYVASGNEEDASRTTPSFCRIVLVATAGLAVALSVVSRSLIPRLLPSFVPSLVPLYLLMPGVVIATIFRVLSSDLNGRGRPLETFYPAITTLVVECLAGLMVIPRYGLVGAALVTSAGYALNSTLYALSYRRLAKIRMSDLFLLQPIDLRRMQSAARGVFAAKRTVRPEIALVPEDLSLPVEK